MDSKYFRTNKQALINDKFLVDINKALLSKQSTKVVNRIMRTIKKQVNDEILKENLTFQQLILKTLDLSKTIVSQTPVNLDPLACCFDMIKDFYKIYQELKKKSNSSKPKNKQINESLDNGDSEDDYKKEIDYLKSELDQIKKQNEQILESVRNQVIHGKKPDKNPFKEAEMILPPNSLHNNKNEDIKQGYKPPFNTNLIPYKKVNEEGKGSLESESDVEISSDSLFEKEEEEEEQNGNNDDKVLSDSMDIFQVVGNDYTFHNADKISNTSDNSDSENDDKYLQLKDLLPSKSKNAYKVFLIENIDSQKFDKICKEFKNKDTLGFDTEFTPGDNLTYLQLSSKKIGAVFNLHKLKKTPKLMEFISQIFLTNKRIIGFSINHDIIAMKKFFGINIGSSLVALDQFLISEKAGNPVGLTTYCSRFFGKKIIF